MKFKLTHPCPLAVLAAAGLLTAGLGISQLSTANAQDVPPTPPATGQRGERPPAPPRDGGPREHGPGGGPKHGPRDDDGGPDGPGPRGERPPHPPRPGDEAPAKPVDPAAAPAAVKAASDAAAGFTPGQVWTRTAPRGEQQLQATVLFQNKEVARLEFDPATGAVLARGFHPAPPMAPPGAAPVAAPAASAPAPVAPPNPDQVKARLAEVIKGLSVGQGAEVMPREGFWKVPLIYQNRVVGELRVSGDGQKVIQDFGAARDAAIFARN